MNFDFLEKYGADFDNMGGNGRQIILKAQEFERQRIARDLHDSTVQTLTGMVHKLEFCCRVLENDPVRCHLEMKVIGNNLRKSIGEIRDIIYDLRPMAFDDIGLDVALRQLVDRIAGKSIENVKISLNICNDLSKIQDVAAFSILHLVEEACNNSLKHSKCRNIFIDIDIVGDNRLKLCISDDGEGFDLKNMKNDKAGNSGFGIPIMRERVYLLNGSFEIESDIGSGTKILIYIPL